MTTIASPEFVRELRWALYHLYDPAQLQRSPLLALFALDERADPLLTLHPLLLAAVEALRPGPNIPQKTIAQRMHGVLFHRFVEQFTQRQVAKVLLMSTRQLRRQEEAGLQVLADRLWTRYNLDSAAARLPVSAPAVTDVNTTPDMPNREAELAWSQRSFASQAVGVRELVDAVVVVVVPLIRTLDVETDVTVPAGLPMLAVPPAVVRQALLNALTAALRAAPGGRVHVVAEAGQRQVLVSVVPVRSNAQTAPVAPQDYATSLDMARQLAEGAGGSLTMTAGNSLGSPFQATFAFPAAATIGVLCIDDNADTLQLFDRYMVGTRYHCIGIPDTRQALAQAEHPDCDVIILDVMLPDIDGWDMLGRLRAHPKTSNKPVVICTIMPQEQLALALGAAAFLQKPVSREMLLAELDRLTGQPEKAPS